MPRAGAINPTARPGRGRLRGRPTSPAADASSQVSGLRGPVGRQTRDRRRCEGHTAVVLPLLRASHLQPTLAVTAITVALAISAGRGGAAAWAALAVLAGQLSVGWSNDYLDRDRDARAGRTDKPIVRGEVAAPVVGLAALIAVTLCVPLSLLSGWRAALVHVGAVALAWAYNLRLKALVFSPLPYAVAFGALPAFVTLGLDGHPAPAAWAVGAGALLGFGAHFVNSLPDLADDERLGVRGLPHRIGPVASVVVAATSMGAAALVLALAPGGRIPPVVVALLAVVLVAVVVVAALGLGGRARLAWPLTLCIAGATVVMFLARGGSFTAS
jgi:4-hydroxybenzoate polyprenyltransferase